MSLLPRTATEIARQVASGKICAHCSAEFTKAHRSPTACRFCFRRLSADERGDTPLAVHPEVFVEAYKEQARKARQGKR